MKQQLSTSSKLPKKSLGQNFIKDENFLLKINNYIRTNHKTIVIEIGPGKGALTKYLAQKYFSKLYLLEKDNLLSLNLIDQYSYNKDIIVKNVDALHFNFKSLIKKEKKIIIIGNLPFNISTQLLYKWLEGNAWPPFYSEMILMFQKEVAERIIAKNKNKKYGKLSIIAQSRCKVEKIIKAPRTIFYPKPKIDGMILKFTPIMKYKNIKFNNLQLLLNASFKYRRKKIKTSLKDFKIALDKLNIDKNLRAEDLTVDDYCRLSYLIS